MLINNMGKIIEESGYKREYIQKYLKINRNTLSNWIHGKSYPRAPELYKLAYLLKKDVGEFYTYIEEKNQ